MCSLRCYSEHCEFFIEINDVVCLKLLSIKKEEEKLRYKCTLIKHSKLLKIDKQMAQMSKLFKLTFEILPLLNHIN